MRMRSKNAGSWDSEGQGEEPDLRAGGHNDVGRQASAKKEESSDSQEGLGERDGVAGETSFTGSPVPEPGAPQARPHTL